ncbi:MAG: phosphate ABC transporter permease PstA [Candidatus Omnitrophica bacterium]|nr:phosphate ABC transporter permease PstA [Candidatus Omnitrophota bacterium]
MRLNPKITEKIAFAFLFLSTLVIVVPVILITIELLKNGMSVMSWKFLTESPRMGMRAGGIFPAIVGTVYLIVLTILFALPVGILAAIYLSEYARDHWLSKIIDVAIVNLAGVPSVVYGLFGLGIFVTFLNFGTSIVAGALTLSIMSLPVIITSSREALGTIPESFRESSLALGATRWQTIRRIVIPNALPGIITGAILALSRAAGETAPILFTVAAFYLPHLPKTIFDQCMALPYHLYVLATQVPNVKAGVEYGTALVLVAMILILNLMAGAIRSHFRKKKQW